MLNSSRCGANFSSDEIYTATAHFCNEKKSESSDIVLLKRGLYQGTRLVIQTDASKKGWGVFCQSKLIGRQWTLQESAIPINVLELKVVKLALPKFVKIVQMNKAHFQLDNMTALSYLVKIGVTQNREITTLAKEICDFALSRKITITA